MHTVCDYKYESLSPVSNFSFKDKGDYPLAISTRRNAKRNTKKDTRPDDYIFTEHTFFEKQSWYAACLEEFNKLNKMAVEEGLTLSTKACKEIAKTLLDQIAYFDLPLPQPLIYPSEDGVIALYFTQNGSFVSVHCGPHDVVCYSTINDERKRCRFEDGVKKKYAHKIYEYMHQPLLQLVRETTKEVD